MRRLPIFIGWDSREPVTYDVAAYSVRQRATIPIEISPIKLKDLRARKFYWRADDPLAATEFTYSRFLTPFLAGFEGWALFCDSDFLWLADVEELVRNLDRRKAVYCVQHDYRPAETKKMDGRVQSLYPRKNWSSLMLFNCAHPSTQRLTPETVNKETGAYLHRMQWVDDEDIGELPMEWNWLEGWNKRPATGTPKAVHFTRGGPWFENWRSVEYAELWLQEEAKMKASAKPL
jgi:hypothetical protein